MCLFCKDCTPSSAALWQLTALCSAVEMFSACAQDEQTMRLVEAPGIEAPRVQGLLRFRGFWMRLGLDSVHSLEDYRLSRGFWPSFWPDSKPPKMQT